MEEEMRQRNRKSNFADGSTTNIDAAVSAANLVTMLDPEKMDQDSVQLVAEVTETSEEFVDGMLDIVEDANAAESSGVCESTVVENFSSKTEKIIKNFSESNPRKRKKSKNFADTEVLTDTINKAVDVVSMLAKDTLEECTTTEIASTIADATDVPTEIIEPVVAIAQDNFSAGKKAGLSYQRKLASRKKYFADAASEPDKIIPIEKKEPDPTVASTTVDEKPVISNALPEKDVLQTSAPDPKPGDVTSDPTDAAKAMALANDMAIVESLKDVPGNFSTPKSDNFSNLKTILGASYVPNEQ